MQLLNESCIASRVCLICTAKTVHNIVLQWCRYANCISTRTCYYTCNGGYKSVQSLALEHASIQALAVMTLFVH